MRLLKSIEFLLEKTAIKVQKNEKKTFSIDKDTSITKQNICNFARKTVFVFLKVTGKALSKQLRFI